jgi:hypothetical protein
LVNPKTFLVLVCATIPVFRALLSALSRNLESEFIHRSRKLLPLAKPQGCPAGHVSPGKGGGVPLPGWNVKSWSSPQIVGIKGTSVPKTNIQETENLDKAISFEQKGANMYSL